MYRRAAGVPKSRVTDEIESSFGGGGIDVSSTAVDAPGARFYAGLRFQIYAAQGNEYLHLGDGGQVDWSRRMLADDRSGWSSAELSSIASPRSSVEAALVS